MTWYIWISASMVWGRLYLLYSHNDDVRNDTADLYRYFDCTRAAEFLYRCVKRTVDQDLPKGIEYLRRHDRTTSSVMETIDMPDRLAQNFILFVRQNNGQLSTGKRERFFASLTESELVDLEEIVNEEFEEFDDTYQDYDWWGINFARLQIDCHLNLPCSNTCTLNLYESETTTS